MSQPLGLLVYALIALSASLAGSSTAQPAPDLSQSHYAQDEPGRPGGTPGKKDRHHDKKASAGDKDSDTATSADTSRKTHSHKSAKKSKKASAGSSEKSSTPK
jgi:hypothetical protein